MAGFLLLAVLAGGCASRGSIMDLRAKATRAPDAEINIAAIWPYTAVGTGFGPGITLALSEINAEGGVNGRPIRLIQVDDESTVTGGMAAAQTLAADESILAVIGHRKSFVALPAADVYDRAGLVYIAPGATSPELSRRGYKRTFRTIPSDTSIGEQMARHMAKAGFKRVAIAYADEVYARGLAGAFEDAANAQGMQVVDRTLEFTDIPRTQNIVNKWRASGFDSIFVAATFPRLAEIISLLRQAGVDQPVFGGDSFDTVQLFEAAGAFSEGVVFGTVFDPGARRPEVQKFVQVFTERYGVAPDTWAAQGYDALHLLADALRQTKVITPDALADALRSIKGWVGVTGVHSFGPDGEVIDKPIVYKTVKNQRFVLLDE